MWEEEKTNIRYFFIFLFFCFLERDKEGHVETRVQKKSKKKGKSIFYSKVAKSTLEKRKKKKE